MATISSSSQTATAVPNVDAILTTSLDISIGRLKQQQPTNQADKRLSAFVDRVVEQAVPSSYLDMSF